MSRLKRELTRPGSSPLLAFACAWIIALLVLTVSSLLASAPQSPGRSDAKVGIVSGVSLLRPFSP